MKSQEERRWLELSSKPATTAETRQEKENARLEFESVLRNEIKALSTELINAGAEFIDPWEMVNSKEPYSEAIDILIKHLPLDYHDKNKEGIIRSLTVKQAKGKANQPLLKEYNVIAKEKHNLRWAIGNAFNVIITMDDVPEICAIVIDPSNGMSRQRFVEALGKVRSEESTTCLKTLLQDEEMRPYASKFF